MNARSLLVVAATIALTLTAAATVTRPEVPSPPAPPAPHVLVVG